MCGGLGFGAGGGSLPLDFTAAMTAAIPTSREPMASIAFQTSSMSHLLPLSVFVDIIIIAQLSKLCKLKRRKMMCCNELAKEMPGVMCLWSMSA